MSFTKILSKFISGTPTNDDAAAGDLGEYLESTNSGGNTNFPSSGTWGDMGSINLTPGDWDVSLIVVVSPGAASSIPFMFIGISTTSGNSSAGLVTGNNQAGDHWRPDSSIVSGSQEKTMAIPNYRMKIASNTTVYAKIDGNFTGTPVYNYRLSARRVR